MSLTSKHCIPCEGGVPTLDPKQIAEHLKTLPNWYVRDDGKAVSRDVSFENYYQTIAFVNAIAWMAHHENHHPDLQVGYGQCQVTYRTHAIHGLSDNDFICAAKVDAILDHNLIG